MEDLNLTPPDECFLCGSTFYPTSSIEHWDDQVTDVMRTLCVACVLSLPIAAEMAVDEVEIKGYP